MRLWLEQRGWQFEKAGPNRRFRLLSAPSRLRFHFIKAVEENGKRRGNERGLDSFYVERL